MLSSDPSEKEAPVAAVGFAGPGTVSSALSARLLAAGAELSARLLAAGAELTAGRDAAPFGLGLAGCPAVRW